jgi:hypothetical protein
MKDGRSAVPSHVPGDDGRAECGPHALATALPRRQSWVRLQGRLIMANVKGTRPTSRPHLPPLETEKWGLMTACMQPGCIGTIVDDYCDVCGSPAGAPPFIPAGAAASAPSAGLAGGPGLTAGRQRPRVPPAPRNGRLMTACMQPGCTGTIVDDYCDVCGSPAGAPPFIPAGAVARQPNLAEEERPIQPIPRVQITTEPSSTQDTAVPASTDPGAPGIEKVEEEKVDPAAAHQELSMALGWSRSIWDIELMIASIRSGTGKVDAEKADPVAADTEQADTEIAAPTATQPVDTEQADSTAADTKKTEAAPPGPDNPDTVETPPVGAALTGGRQPRPQLVEQQDLAPLPDQTPVDKKRFGFLALAATILAALLIGALFSASRDGSGVTAQSDATRRATATMTASKPTSEQSGESMDTGSNEPTIQLEDLAASARPFEAVRIQGTYRGGAGSFLRVQRWEGGKWLDFPLPTKTDQSGRFITQAEFGQPGRYRLRVLDPDSGVTSKPFVVVIKG